MCVHNAPDYQLNVEMNVFKKQPPLTMDFLHSAFVYFYIVPLHSIFVLISVKSGATYGGSASLENQREFDIHTADEGLHGVSLHGSTCSTDPLPLWVLLSPRAYSSVSNYSPVTDRGGRPIGL
jgi:hypothetical protein